ncbi:hypothetical protein D3C75_740920 [compost metagenome]
MAVLPCERIDVRAALEAAVPSQWKIFEPETQQIVRVAVVLFYPEHLWAGKASDSLRICRAQSRQRSPPAVTQIQRSCANPAGISKEAVAQERTRAVAQYLHGDLTRRGAIDRELAGGHREGFFQPEQRLVTGKWLLITQLHPAVRQHAFRIQAKASGGCVPAQAADQRVNSDRGEIVQRFVAANITVRHPSQLQAPFLFLPELLQGTPVERCCGWRGIQLLWHETSGARLFGRTRQRGHGKGFIQHRQVVAQGRAQALPALPFPAFYPRRQLRTGHPEGDQANPSRLQRIKRFFLWLWRQWPTRGQLVLPTALQFSKHLLA